MTAPFFSIILPTFNRAHILWRAIQSVQSQIENHWELIVVDDGSTDDTLALVEEFQDSRIRIISMANAGPAAARNAGLAQATGQFIAYLDSDNVMYPSYLSEFRQHIEQQPDCVLWYCGQHNVFWDRTAGGRWTVLKRSDDLRAQYDLNEILGFNGPDTGAMVHRAGIAESVGGWDEQCRWLEDWDFFTRICLAFSSRTSWVPRALYEYRQVHGEAPDGLCAEAHADCEQEQQGRQYLLDKWHGNLTEAGVRKLSDMPHFWVKLGASAPDEISRTINS